MKHSIGFAIGATLMFGITTCTGGSEARPSTTTAPPAPRITNDWRPETKHSILRHPTAAAIEPPGDTDIGARVSSYGADVPLAYYALSLTFTKRTAGFTPPVQSRAYAYMGLALYEAVVSGMPRHRSIARQLNGVGELPHATEAPHHWPLVANAALAEVMRGLWGGTTNMAAANIADLDALEASFAAQYGNVPPGIQKRSVDFGREVGAAVFETSKDDGGHEGYKTNFPAYTPPVGPGLWVPTTPGASAVQPYWGTTVATFALTSGAECDPGGPPTYSEQPDSDFYLQAYQVYQTVNNLTPEQRTIARFWADGGGSISGPGHSLAIANQILVQQNANLEVAAETYARVGIADADAVTAVWWTKYHYNVLRPITYIRNVIDSAWTTALPATPSFPEYVSAHSSQSAAAASSLEYLFGESVPFVDHAHDVDGFTPRSFGRIYAAAEEAGISRIYGGIHFPSGNLDGQWQGRCVAAVVNNLNWRK
jgi:PAP2 superfamily